MPHLVKKTAINSKLEAARAQFIEGGGRIAASLLGMLNRVSGQIYGLLFLSPEPLSLDDIVAELRVSKGNVSVNIRLLEDFKLVKKVWVKGTRKDYYQAIDTLPRAIIKEFIDKMKRSIADSLDMIDDCCDLVSEAGRGDEVSFMKERLELVRSFYAGAEIVFNMLYSGKHVDTSLLKPIFEDS